ncbi:MAG: GNAT family N-acetyltransferase [Balneola sp.]|nr:MAG: GNAT family N-acetyltransferase [Balneola sp.]
MIDVESLNLRLLDLEGVKTLVGWAMEEGWNPGKHDYEAFYKADPDGFYGFFYKDRLIAGGAIVSYSGNYGFMGLFIVHPDFRGKGIGNKLWYLRRDKLIERLNKGAIIGMDGVVAMQPFYQKGGFEIAFIDERYECIGKSFPVSENISNIEPEEFYLILEFDTKCFGYERAQFLSKWFKLPDSQFFKYSNGDEIDGYAVIREVESGYKIGPLFANNEIVAQELYKACLNSVIGDPVYLDIPTTNKGALELVKKYDAKYVFECARMYYGGNPEVDINRVFGITTFELG